MTGGQLLRRSGVCSTLLLIGLAAAPVGGQQGAPPAPIMVSIPPDLVAKGGIETAVAVRGHISPGLRVPATVQPHAYRQVTVVATAAGRVMSVPVELGQRLRAGDLVARVHSPEVAEAERIYVARQAELSAMRLQVARLERLVTIGAASQQELESARAQQTSLAADLEGVRARLVLLGRAAAQVAALTDVNTISADVTYPAPIDGTVTSRTPNAGQTIDSGSPIVTIVDLSTVWVIGDVYERDLAAVRVGTAVTITSAALPGEALTGRVSYVDPQIAPDSRTARVRVEIANRGGRLLLGMLMEMRIESGAVDAIVVPRQAIQTIGDVPVVYIADAARAGTFTERSVRLGSAHADAIEILAGVAAGERVVTSGSFLVRSERDRASAVPARPVPTRVPSPATPAPRAESPRVVDIAITKDGFVPAEVVVPAGSPVRLRFTRQVEKTCATDVVFPALKITKPLPLKTAVVIDVPARTAGVLSFACGMDMYKGQVVVR